MRLRIVICRRSALCGVVAILLAGVAFAQTKIPLGERLWVASKIYASIPIYFGHWQAVPDLDLDAVYKE